MQSQLIQMYGRFSHQIGASLIEMMVALLIVAVGTLGVLAMQVNAFRLNQNAHMYSQASILAHDIYDAMQTVNNETRDTFASCNEDCADPVGWYQSQWSEFVNQYLPGGEYSIVRNDDNYFVITVSFIQESAREDTNWSEQQDGKSEYSLNVEF